MIVAEAETRAAALFAPLSLEALFEAVGEHRSFDLHGGPGHARAGLLGVDPAAAVLAGFATHAGTLDCHSPAPLGPAPGPAAVGDAGAFRALIEAYHDRGYTVRVPDARTLSPVLQEAARALEILTHAPVDASVFWSRAHARAKIHYDNNDNISVQLSGRKRWFIADGPTTLDHSARSAGDAEPRLDPHRVVDVEPGDLIYIPRGLPHAVESTTDSIHVSILFTPLTWREAIVAALDHFGDLSRPVRATAAGRIAGAEGLGEALAPGIAEMLQHLLASVREPGFVDTALGKRSSQIVGNLARLTPPGPPVPLTASTRLRHAPLAAMHRVDAARVIDLAAPGGHLLLHPATGPCLFFIAATPAFTPADIPGLPTEHCIALAERLIAAGLLEVEA